MRRRMALALAVVLSAITLAPAISTAAEIGIDKTVFRRR